MNSSLVAAYRAAKLADVPTDARSKALGSFSTWPDHIAQAFSKFGKKAPVKTTTNKDGTTTTEETETTMKDFKNDQKENLDNRVEQVLSLDGDMGNNYYMAAVKTLRQSQTAFSDDKVDPEKGAAYYTTTVDGEETIDEEKKAEYEAAIENGDMQFFYDNQLLTDLAQTNAFWTPTENEQAANVILNEVVQSTENMKQLRMSLAELISGKSGELSNYTNSEDWPLMETAFLEFLDPNAKVAVTGDAVEAVDDPNTPDIDESKATGREFKIFIPSLNKWFTASEFESYMDQYVKDAGTIVDINKLRNQTKQSGIELAQFNRGKLGDDAEAPDQLTLDSFMQGAKNVVDKTTNINSLIHDDILGNGRSFMQDLDEFPTFRKFKNKLNIPKEEFVKKIDGEEIKKMFNLEKGEVNWYDNISEADMLKIKEAITDPHNPFYDEQTTKNLLTLYVGTSLQETYKNSSKKKEGRKSSRLLQGQINPNTGEKYTPEDMISLYTGKTDQFLNPPQ